MFVLFIRAIFLHWVKLYIILIHYINLYLEPGIEAAACARELLYVYLCVSMCSVSWFVVVRLSVPVQVTDWKDVSPK